MRAVVVSSGVSGSSSVVPMRMVSRSLIRCTRPRRSGSGRPDWIVYWFASSVALARDVAAVCELGDDPVRGAFEEHHAQSSHAVPARGDHRQRRSAHRCHRSHPRRTPPGPATQSRAARLVARETDQSDLDRYRRCGRHGCRWRARARRRHYDKQVVHDQLAPQKIFFPKPATNPALAAYAGQQVLTGKQAKLYAQKQIGVDLAKVADGKTYSQISAEWIAGGMNNTTLASERTTLFMG
jgi:hypothetical protein